MRRELPADRPRRREHPTSSKRAASTWLRKSKRTPAELRLFLEVLRFAAAVSAEARRQRRSQQAEDRRVQRVRKRAERLAASAPNLVEVRLKSLVGDPEDWRFPYLSRRVERALAATRPGRPTAARFARAAAALPGCAAPGRTDDTMNDDTAAAAMLAIAARCVRTKKPSAMEAAALAVASGFEPPVTLQRAQDAAERRWGARFRLVQARVKDALLDHAQGRRTATTFDSRD